MNTTTETKSRKPGSEMTLAYKLAITENVVRPDLEWLMTSLRDRSCMLPTDAVTAIIGCAVDLAREEILRLPGLPDAHVALCRANLMACIDLHLRRAPPA